MLLVPVSHSAIKPLQSYDPPIPPYLPVLSPTPLPGPARCCRLANSLNFPLSVETVCVFTAPVFSAFAAWATFLLTNEVKGPGAGLTAAALIAMVGRPSVGAKDEFSGVTTGMISEDVSMANS